ncbi:MAG: DMT family transporter [Roseibium sp.]|uniref:DMT family transporter n=1 Tax=Roseibium sp. TaxID=1936156 RepID=UPI00261966CC|nr:DMT family transporter [Roseibium sp.]MCV0426134.1 DMT family transporter [Roseibium sp.]
MEKQDPVAQNRNLGIACAVGVLLVWSGFIVFSRAGVQTNLTAMDMTGLRFLVAGGITLPFVWKWWPRHLPWKAVLLMSLCGPGIIYSLLMYWGLNETSAAYAGVFANGSLPVFTVVLVAVFSASLPGKSQFVGLSVIVAGAALVGSAGFAGSQKSILFGVILFLAASAVLAIYIFGVRYWKVSPRQALALVNVPNAFVFVPIWLMFLPSGLAETGLPTILFQALYQGLGPGIAAVIMFALAATHLGPTATAGFSAAVPASAAVFAIPVLGEVPDVLEWIGIGVVTLGLSLLVINRQ